MSNESINAKQVLMRGCICMEWVLVMGLVLCGILWKTSALSWQHIAAVAFLPCLYVGGKTTEKLLTMMIGRSGQP